MDLEQFMTYGTSLVSQRYFYFRILPYLYINLVNKYKVFSLVPSFIYLLASAKVVIPDAIYKLYKLLKIHVVNLEFYSELFDSELFFLIRG